MPAAHFYWEGLGRAHVKPIQSSVIRHYPEAATQALNIAFWVYFAGVKFAKAMEAAKPKAPPRTQGQRLLSDATRLAAPPIALASSIHDYVKELKTPLGDLRYAARSGMGRGVSDLEEAFDHIAGSPDWRDNNSRAYSGSFGNFPGCPVAAANFFSAIDTRISEATSLMKEYKSVSERLAAAAAGTNTLNSAQWQRVGEDLATIQTITETIEQYAWLVPVGLAGGPRSLGHVAQESLEFVSSGVEGFGKVISTINDARSMLEAFDSAMKSNVTNQNGTAALLVVLQKVAGTLPVLGEFYAQAICIIPVVADIFESIAYTRLQQMHIARYGATPGQTMPHVGSTE